MQGDHDGMLAVPLAAPTLPMPASSSVREFLQGDDWRARFDDVVLEEGGKLARKRRVSDLAWSSQEDGGGILSAVVRDLEGESHEVELSLWQEGEGRWELDTACSCPYAHYCQHAAAPCLLRKKTVLERLLKAGVLAASRVRETPAPCHPRPVPCSTNRSSGWRFSSSPPAAGRSSFSCSLCGPS